MRLAAFTVDVDRDVNEPKAGCVEAVCRNGSAPTFRATGEGLELLVDLLGELGIRATFFLEGETAERLAERLDLKGLLRGHEAAAHGYAHEDLTGESTGIYPSREWTDAIVGRSAATVEDLLGRRPLGFRAPYQHIDREVVQVLTERGFVYDSTRFAELGGTIEPYRWDTGLIEVPVARGRDRNGRSMQSYLWPLHEGKRIPSDYVHLMAQHHGGLLVLADHSWHIVESLSAARGPREVREEVEKVREVLQGALDQGIEFMTVEEYVRTKVVP